jgi:hypothetical protein
MPSVAFFSSAALAVLALSFAPADAQTLATRYEVVPVRSSVYGQTINVFVYTSKTAPGEASSLPVVYVPQFDKNDSTYFQRLEQLIQSGAFPYMRIVGIEGYGSDAPALAAEPAVFAIPKGMGAPTTAANEWYYRFIASEVVPAVEEKYRCSAFRALCIDESSVFGAYMIGHQSRGFSAYLSLSPLVWFNEGRRPLSTKSFLDYYFGKRAAESLIAAADDSDGNELYLKTGRRSGIKQ